MCIQTFMQIGKRTNDKTCTERARETYKSRHVHALAHASDLAQLSPDILRTHTDRSHVTHVPVGVMAQCLHAPSCMTTSV